MQRAIPTHVGMKGGFAALIPGRGAKRGRCPHFCGFAERVISASGHAPLEAGPRHRARADRPISPLLALPCEDHPWHP